MNWYKVTKTINGRQYLYWQKTYRVGKSVKTLNRYIGPASNAAPTLEPSTYSITAPYTPEDVRDFLPRQRPLTQDERDRRKENLKRVREDERIQYGSLQARKDRQAAQLKAARKLTRHLRPLNFFAAKLALVRKK